MGRRPPKKMHAPPLDLMVERLGARGDGIARHQGQPVYIPYSLPGETVRVRLTGRRGDGLTAAPLAILTPAGQRQTPPCPSFGRCGGCLLQHLAETPYRDWKRGLLVEALSREGFDPGLIGPLLAIPPQSRRRAAFAFHRTAGGIVLGFNEKSGHQLIDIGGCLLLDPALDALLAPLKHCLARIVPAGTRGDAIATLAESGIDLVIETAFAPDLFAREALASFAVEQDLARLSWRRDENDAIEPLCHRRPVVVRFGAVPVELPPAAFLQPSRQGEAALAGLVTAAAAGSARIADLFAGSGAFTFPLSAFARVHAVEGDQAALEALARAAAIHRPKVGAERRDLARRPLQGAELKDFDAVVLDPPRVGAAAQAQALAEAGPPLVVAVSCNPATLARDARILAGGGYRLVQATPVDQFPWSAHLEAVALFRR